MYSLSNTPMLIRIIPSDNNIRIAFAAILHVKCIIFFGGRKFQNKLLSYFYCSCWCCPLSVSLSLSHVLTHMRECVCAYECGFHFIFPILFSNWYSNDFQIHNKCIIDLWCNVGVAEERRVGGAVDAGQAYNWWNPMGNFNRDIDMEFGISNYYK